MNARKSEKLCKLFCKKKVLQKPCPEAEDML